MYKRQDKKKTLAYAVAFYFTEASIKFMMGNTIDVYKRQALFREQAAYGGCGSCPAGTGSSLSLIHI